MPAEAPQLSWGNSVALGGLVLSLLGGVWVIMSNQNSMLGKELNAVRVDLKAERDFRRTEIRELHNSVPSREEFKENQNRIDERLKLIQDQLIRLEATRPTTGELRAIGQSSEELARKLEERVRDLEKRKP